MTGGTRTLLGTALGLAMMQLIVSTGEQGGKSGQLLGTAFQLPAEWLRSFIDPTKPGIPTIAKKPDSSGGGGGSWQDGLTGVLPNLILPGSTLPNLIGTSALGPGLSGTPQTTGTGSNVMNV